MGLLDGFIAKEIYKGFKSKLLKGTMRRAAPDPALGLDKLGDPEDTTDTEWACQGFVDGYSETFRALAGIPDTDSKVGIFAQSLPSGVRPQKDDTVEMPAGTTYQLRNVSVDPATALWECRAFKVQSASDEDCRTRGF
jgi:hypothetical protein